MVKRLLNGPAVAHAMHGKGRRLWPTKAVFALAICALAIGLRLVIFRLAFIGQLNDYRRNKEAYARRWAAEGVDASAIESSIRDVEKDVRSQRTGLWASTTVLALAYPLVNVVLENSQGLAALSILEYLYLHYEIYERFKILPQWITHTRLTAVAITATCTAVAINITRKKMALREQLLVFPIFADMLLILADFMIGDLRDQLPSQQRVPIEASALAQTRPALISKIVEAQVKCGLGHVDVLVVESNASNLYALSNSWQMAIVITTRALKDLSDSQLISVFTHELEHFISDDMSYVCLAHVVKLALLIALAMTAYRHIGRVCGNANALLCMFFIFQLYDTLFFLALNYFLKHPAEFRADRSAFEAGHGTGMIEALKLIFKARPSNALFDFGGLYGAYFGHPPMLKRIERLRRYAGDAHPLQ